VSRYEHIKNVLGREDLHAAGICCAFDVSIINPHGDKRPGDIIQLGSAIPGYLLAHDTAIDVTIGFSRVAARLWRAAEEPAGSATFVEKERSDDFDKAIAAAAAAAGMSIPTILSWDFRPLAFRSIQINFISMLRLEQILLRVSPEVVYPKCRDAHSFLQVPTFIGEFNKLAWKNRRVSKSCFMQNHAEIRQCHHRSVTSNDPSANGTTEVICCAVLKALRKLTSRFQLGLNKWPRVEHIVQSILNNTPSIKLAGIAPITVFT
jgi:hypothetical protein